MKISKQSWHYRLNRAQYSHFSYFMDRGSYTTCSYIRATAWAVIVNIAKIIAFMAFCVLTLTLCCSMVVSPIMIFAEMTPPKVMLLFCMVGWFSVTLVLAIAFIGALEPYIAAMFVKRPKRQPSVFTQAIIDRHNKICTLVSTDDSSD